MSITNEIAELEKKLAQLREQERAEKEEAKAKARQEREADLNTIKNLLNEFNKKYNDTLCLGIKRNSDVGKDLFETLFPWL